MLIDHPDGYYRFLKGIDPYSCGVVAGDGFEIVQITLRRPVPWREGFDRIDYFLSAQGRSRTALCGMQLRCHAPYSMEGFKAFNLQYCQVLRDWGLYLDQVNPLARTNVAPLADPPAEPMLYAFSVVQPAGARERPSFVVAGAGELVEGALDEEGIICRGRTDGPAMHEKAAYVLKVMHERLSGLGADWHDVTRVNIYTAHFLPDIWEQTVLPKLGAAQAHGVHWVVSHPPVEQIEFEMDMRGVACELFID